MKRLTLIAALVAIATIAALGQANTSLSNLHDPTTVNQSLIPSVSNTLDLGSASLQWDILYLDGPIYIDGTRFVDNPVSGGHNTAVGWDVLHSVITGGVDNTGVGYHALYSNTDGSDNTAVGSNALYYNYGSNNTAFGERALYFNTSGNSNTASGVTALFNNTTGNYNTANGLAALYNATTGFNNTAVGYSAGYDEKTGSNHTFAGYLTDCGSVGAGSNSTAIGANAQFTSSNTVRIGNASVTSIGGYASWTNVSDARVKKNINENVPGLAFIELLKPVTYNYNLEAADKIIFPDGRPDYHLSAEASAKEKLIEDSARNEKEKIVYSGFLAQDVEAAAEKIGYDFSGVEKPANESSLYGLRYGELVIPLVKAVQELALQRDDLQIKYRSLQNQHEKLEQRFAALETPKTVNAGQRGFSSVESPPQAELGQNLPNPFGNSTVIPFQLPGNYHDASIVIINTSTGEVISSIPISSNDDVINVETATLEDGTFSYTLYVDGNAVDTLSMILNK